MEKDWVYRWLVGLGWKSAKDILEDGKWHEIFLQFLFSACLVMSLCFATCLSHPQCPPARSSPVLLKQGLPQLLFLQQWQELSMKEGIWSVHEAPCPGSGLPLVWAAFYSTVLWCQLMLTCSSRCWRGKRQVLDSETVRKWKISLCKNK